MIDKAIADITKADVDALVDSRRIEDRRIEYERELPGNSDEDKKEFLKDVTAFANALGGDLVYGVDEDDGVPTSAHGIALGRFDDARLRLQNIIRSNVEPRLPELDIQRVGGFSRGDVVVVRVNESWRAPHMVKFGKTSKFYIRHAGQNVEMDVTELRAAFVGTEAIADRMRRVRDDRLSFIFSGHSVLGDPHWPLSILHVVPVAAARDRALLDPRQIGQHWLLLDQPSDRLPLVYGGTARPNLDGLLVFSPRYVERHESSPSYIQVLRDGGIEFVEAHYDRRSEDLAPLSYLPGFYLETKILDAVTNATTFLRTLSLGGAAVVFVTLSGVRNIPLITDDGRGFSMRRGVFDRDVILLPDFLIDQSLDIDELPRALRPLLDSLWQAAGVLQSPSYADDGIFIRRDRRR